jgi:hypothetical protein
MFVHPKKPMNLEKIRLNLNSNRLQARDKKALEMLLMLPPLLILIEKESR